MEPLDKKAGELYRAHLDGVKRLFDAALDENGFEAVVIGAGTETFRFLDDQTYPFKTNPHLLKWLPLTAHPESSLVYRPGAPPRLIIHRPEDYWHEPPALPGSPWDEHFEISAIAGIDELSGHLSDLPARTAWIGEPAQWRMVPEPEYVNPGALLNHLHYHRPFKSAYEIECIRRATARAVPAHRAAEAAFRQGATEQEILVAFLSASGQTGNELPYPAIVATDANAAVLHYQHYDRHRGALHSLLIDAACVCNGYAADITRTHSFDDPEFAGMIDDLDNAQRDICSQVRPGVPFAALHELAHRTVARLLRDWKLVNRDPGELVEKGITALFFPHGLGHFLGIQVHEPGGAMADASGTEIGRPANYPHLRLVRTLEVGQALTIEPGIYFIDFLLERLKKSDISGDVAWDRIERLKKFGGIRIEDNLTVTEEGADNLTRHAFSTIP